MTGFYVCYVLMFNLLVGPVFSAGSITQERERKTLGLLLTTLLQPGTIVIAKLIASARVSTVLTFLLTEQLLLAYVLIPELRDRWWTLLIFLALIGATCLTTTTVGLLCSALSRRTAAAMVLTYLSLLVLFIGPVGLAWYLQGYTNLSDQSLASLTVTSPFAASFSIPIPSSEDGKPYTPSFLAQRVLIYRSARASPCRSGWPSWPSHRSWLFFSTASRTSPSDGDGGAQG